MALERERKFLVVTNYLPTSLPPGKVIEAGYFTDGPFAVRITIKDRGGEKPVYKMCLKGPGTIERQEFEYAVPKEDAEAMMAMAPTYIKKTRIDYGGWEIDKFNLNGREHWTAEWEEAEGKPAIPNPLPDWVGVEVTDIPEFTNMRLAWRYGKR